jgi:hypothetical protein
MHLGVHSTRGETPAVERDTQYEAPTIKVIASLQELTLVKRKAHGELPDFFNPLAFATISG